MQFTGADQSYGSDVNGFGMKGPYSGLERYFNCTLRSYDLPFDPSNVYCITETMIPCYVKFIVSLGHKFAFIPSTSDGPLKMTEHFRFFVERLKSYSKNANQLSMIDHEVSGIISDSRNNEMDDRFYPGALRFITFWMEKAKMFLKDNPNLLVTTADKGGKIVIIDESAYKGKVDHHVTDFVNNGTYERVPQELDFDSVRCDWEKMHKALRDKVNNFLSSENVQQLSFEPYIMAKLVLYIKVHKPGYPVRPVIAAPDRWNKGLSRWILRLLSLIADVFDSVKVKNSRNLVERLSVLGNMTLGHKLSTFDYVSMFTNVPYYVPREIVVNYFYVVRSATNVPMNIFMEILDFIIDSSSYFLCGDITMRQCKGLTMGNELAQVLADIATGYATMMVKASLSSQRVSFIFKYVDDFLTAMDDEATRLFQARMHHMIDGLRLEHTPEDCDAQVTYLDVKIQRLPDGSLTTVWWQKDCSKGYILNYYSNHPRVMKWNIMNAYIRHALSVTSPVAFQLTIKNLKKVLRNSSFPMSVIQSAICSALESIGDIQMTSSIGTPDELIDVHVEVNASQSDMVSGIYVTSNAGNPDESIDVRLEMEASRNGRNSADRCV